MSNVENLRLNKNKSHFMCTRIPIFREILSRDGVQADPRNLHALADMPPLIIK